MHLEPSLPAVSVSAFPHHSQVPEGGTAGATVVVVVVVGATVVVVVGATVVVVVGATVVLVVESEVEDRGRLGPRALAGRAVLTSSRSCLDRASATGPGRTPAAATATSSRPTTARRR
jgi:hypothetical protein